nr:MAG: ORF1 [TTV-like mini virus]
MPFYRGYYRKRRRAFWRRRARGPFRPRRWRRHRYYRYRRRNTVRRKRKLPYLHLKEYQPPYINKLKCKGIIPLFYCTRERLVNNFSMYWYERSEHYVPGGGGFSIICFTLSALYQLFEKCQCYWTRSNTTMPLIRYTGATIKLFRAAESDYITTYHTCFPMKPTLDTYASTHPAILQLNKRHKILTCKKHNKNRKPYLILKLKPPAPIKNRWFFQKELADVPLAMLMTSAASFDRYYLSSTSISTTIEFNSLDTRTFVFHNWKVQTTSGYQADTKKYLWALKNGTTDIQNEKMMNLIYLGDTKNFKAGDTVTSTKATSTNFEAWKRYFQSTTHWGNPFWHEYLQQEKTVLISDKSPHELESKFLNNNNDPTLGADFTTPTYKLIQTCRYNPYSDYGNNHIFITPITDNEKEPWKQPTNPKLEGKQLPLWLNTWGFIDFEKNIIGNKVDTDYVCVLVSDYVNPKLGYYVPIDKDFIEGRSKYQPEHSLPFLFDQLHWHPKVTMQLSSINAIGSSGPGTIKLPPNISAESHAQFTFHFKLGGCAPEPNTIEDPEKQPTFPTPDNISSSTSFQSPTMPIESYIYGFDKRRDLFTAKAIERMQKYSISKELISSITDSNKLQPGPLQETSSEDSEEEKTEKETLLQQLQLQRNKQHKFRQRILQLIQQLSSE